MAKPSKLSNAVVPALNLYQLMRLFWVQQLHAAGQNQTQTHNRLPRGLLAFALIGHPCKVPKSHLSDRALETSSPFFLLKEHKTSGEFCNKQLPSLEVSLAKRKHFISKATNRSALSLPASEARIQCRSHFESNCKRKPCCAPPFRESLRRITTYAFRSFFQSPQSRACAAVQRACIACFWAVA